MALRWKKVAHWDLARNERVLWLADGRDVQYKVTRAGTADKPSWSLYTLRPDGVVERWMCTNRLRDVKSYAALMEDSSSGRE